nr:hypothetical protein [Tanacetum cinerariifolium]
MEAPPSPDYILGPEAPPSPDYIPGPKAPPSPDYIPGPEYPEYLSPADDPLPAAVSPTAESPGYITESEPDMEPDEEDGDDEKSEEDSIEYPTRGGDDDANDDGDDFSKDDADDEDEEESSDSEEEKEEHLAPTVPASALHRYLFNHIYLCHSVRSQSESIPEVDIPLQKRARFTTPTSRYEVGESSVVAAARQIRPALTIADRLRADDRLIGRLRRKRRYFCTLSTTYAQEVAHFRDYCTQIMDYCQSQEVHTSTLVTQIEALQRDVTEEQPLPVVVSPTAKSPGYIMESEPEMEPEEEDGDDEKSEEDSIEYPTNGGDDEADNDGDDLSKDDADDEEEEESSDSEEEHLAPTVPAPALHSPIHAFEDSDETEPFEEGKTAATPPPFGYCVAARISVQPHILMPFHSESEVERLHAIPTPPLSSVSPTSYPLPPFLIPLPIFTPLTTLSFPLPSSLPSTSGSESIPEADIPLRKRARFTTPTGGYEIMDYCQSREVHISTLVTQMEALQRDVSTLQRQHIDDEDRLTRHIQHEHAQRDVAPKDGDRVDAAMAEAEASRVQNGYESNGSGPRLAQAVRECTYPYFLKCQPLNFKGTEGVIGLTQWFEKMESVFNISNCTTACQVKYVVCTLQGVALTWWNSHVKTVNLEVAQALPWKTLKK